MRVILIWIVFLLAPISARAWTHGIPNVVTANCPQGVAYADGCAALASAGQIGFYQATSYNAFQSEAEQSGQTWTAPRPPWNMAGVDYGVGYYTPRASLQIPGTNQLPTGCSLQTVASGEEVLCYPTTTGSINLTGWDFHPTSGPYAGQCIVVLINANAATGAGATITIADNHFEEDLQCVASSAPGSGQLLQVNASPALGGLFVKNNEFDGNCSVVESGAEQSSLVVDSRPVGTGTGTWQYNYFHDSCARPVNAANGSVVFQFNRFTNWCINCSGSMEAGPPPGNGYHGETYQYYPVVSEGSIGSPNIVPSIIYDFNVVDVPSTYYTCCTTVGPFVRALTSGVTYFEELYNFLVTNVSTGMGSANSENVSAGITEFGTNFVTTANVYGNYLDTTGVTGTAPSRDCVVVGGSSSSLPGYITSTTLTIDSTWTLNDGLITAGGIIYGGTSGTAYPTVLPFSTPGTTGNGGPGNYILSASATSTGPYTETAFVAMLTLGSGGSPASGGTSNWSLTTNTAITGYTIVGSGGAQICS